MDLQLIELALPLRRPFRTAAGELTERRVVLVGAVDGDLTGWGEAAPYPGMTPDTVDGVWSSLHGEAALTPTAQAALEEADADLAARQGGMPLWQSMGGAWRPLPTSLAIGFDEVPADRIAEVDPGAVKLKIRPGDDLARVEAVRFARPDLTIGVDANGAYDWEDRDALLALDRFDVAYVEQPFPADDMEGHARLREELLADVVLDEAIDGAGAAVAAIESGAADVLAISPTRIGPEACRVVHDLALAAGLRVKASGLLESGVGRAHTLAVAMLPAAVYSDLGEAAWFFVVPTVLDIGDPGIGVDPDLDALEPFIRRQASVTRPGDPARG